MRVAWSCLLALAALPALAEGYTGHVTHVSDGDTVWVRPVTGGAAQPVRIEGVDAPELCQPGGTEARDALAAQVLHRPVRVIASGRDDYGRRIARLESAGSDVGGWLVRHGHAWSYRFRRDPGPYAREQRLARQARAGLWGAPQPMEPRLFRQFNGPCGNGGPPR